MNIQWKKLSNPVLAEIVGSLLLILCMFLPWFQISYAGGGSHVFLGVNNTGISDWLHTYLCEWIGEDTTTYFSYGYLFYLFPILCVVNIVMQYFFRLPWLSFYVAVSAAFTVVFAYYFLEYIESNINIENGCFGWGLIMITIISVFMMITSWTCLGWNYKKHWIYLSIAFIGAVICIVCLKTNYSPRNVILTLSMFLGAIHIPFLIYAFLLMLCSFFIGKSRI